MLSAQRGACPGQSAGAFVCYHCFSAASPQLSSIPIAIPCWLPKRFPCSVVSLFLYKGTFSAITLSVFVAVLMLTVTSVYFLYSFLPVHINLFYNNR